LIGIDPMPAGGTAVAPARLARMTERHVLALGLAMSGAFVLAAVTVGATAGIMGQSAWAAIHLALAGAATTAIATFVPHFAITLAGTRPEPALQRVAAILLIAAGAASAVLGLTLIGAPWAVGGAAAMVAGLGFTGWQTVVPLRNPLARRHPIVTASYLVAIAEMAAGISLGGLVALGYDPVLAAWATLRAAHAWITLFGAVSLTIFGTLVYLAPTILGARIRPSRWLVAGTIGMLAGPPVATVGFVLGSASVATAGAAATLVGALGQVGYVADAVRRRGPYTSEHDWRRVAVWHLVAGTGWFALAVAAALVELAGGRPLAGWALGHLAVPLVAGWMLQELVGSWTHLAPSVTPGDAARHAAQRRRLAGASRLRPITWNVGVALAWAGVATGATPVAVAGGAALGLAVIISALLLLRALTPGRY
jgi:nitrite reductase (NO-forming)